MQQMPDKEFDKLFQDHFVDAEMEPSMDLWANIEREIAPKKKRALPIYWMAAASVAVAFTAMMLFQKEEKMQLHGTGVALAQNDAVQTISSTENQHTIEHSLALATDAESANSLAVFKASLKKSADNQFVENKVENISVAMQPSQPVEHLAIKRTEIQPMDMTPKEETTSSQIYYASVELDKELGKRNAEIENANQRKSIGSVGDLVNFVVDKVDKRDKKLIEFGSDEDEGSELVGINIGFLKWNKKHKN